MGYHESVSPIPSPSLCSGSKNPLNGKAEEQTKKGGILARHCLSARPYLRGQAAPFCLGKQLFFL